MTLFPLRHKNISIRQLCISHTGECPVSCLEVWLRWSIALLPERAMLRAPWDMDGRFQSQKKKKKKRSRAARFCLAVLHHLSTQNIVSEPNQPAITARTNPSHRPQRARPNNSPLRKPSTQHLCSQLYHRSTNSAPRRRPQRRGGERGSRQYLPTKRM